MKKTYNNTQQSNKIDWKLLPKISNMYFHNHQWGSLCQQLVWQNVWLCHSCSCTLICALYATWTMDAGPPPSIVVLHPRSPDSSWWLSLLNLIFFSFFFFLFFFISFLQWSPFWSLIQPRSCKLAPNLKKHFGTHQIRKPNNVSAFLQRTCGVKTC